PARPLAAGTRGVRKRHIILVHGRNKSLVAAAGARHLAAADAFHAWDFSILAIRTSQGFVPTTGIAKYVALAVANPAFHRAESFGNLDLDLLIREFTFERGLITPQIQRVRPDALGRERALHRRRI